MWSCEKAREIVPDDTRFVFLQGVALQRKGDASGAEPLLRQVIEAAPALAPAHLEHGMALLTQGKLAAARKSLDTAVELQPDLTAAWRALYDVRAAEGDDASARTSRSRAPAPVAESATHAPPSTTSAV